MTTTTKIDAYWFAASDTLSHGDNRKIIVGETHSLQGKIVICEHGLHASRQPYDALQCATGPYLYKVRCWGDVIDQYDKLACRHREYVAKIDATVLLRQFAREQASSVLHLWNAPQVVKDWLATGDEAIRSAARSAAWSAAESAARSPADSVAWSAAESAARHTAWGAARNTAESAARSAAWSTAESAARSATRSAARNTAESTARSVTTSVARKRFNNLVEAAFEAIYT